MRFLTDVISLLLFNVTGLTFPTSLHRLAKIEAKHMPGMRIGTVATHDINSEDVYLQISPDIILDRNSALACPTLGKVWAELRKKMPRGDPYHELLLHLLHERLVKKERSKFWSVVLCARRDMMKLPNAYILPSSFPPSLPYSLSILLSLFFLCTLIATSSHSFLQAISRCPAFDESGRVSFPRIL